MSDELKNTIVESGERLPVGAGDVGRVVAGGKRRLRVRRFSYGLLSVAFVGAGWFAGTQLMGNDTPTIGIAGETPSPEPTVVESAPGRLCPNDTDGGLIIDWTNFIQFHWIRYVANPYEPRKLPKDFLGDVWGTVKCTIQDQVAQSDYMIQNGDAAFLEPGTKVYQVKGYAPTFRLAARWNGNYVFYDVDWNPAADVGEALLDIRDKVSSIEVETDAGESATLNDPDQIERLTEMVLTAPVDLETDVRGNDNIFVTFHLKDGTGVVRALSPRQNIMSRGIRVPPQFVDELEEAMERSGKD